MQNYADGFLLSEVLFEDGFLDIPAMWAVLKKSNPKLLPMHELITRDPLKVPVLTDKYWVTWPDRSGKYLADTIRLVNANASKKPLPMISTLSARTQFQAEESNNIRCFEWAQEDAGLTRTVKCITVAEVKVSPGFSRVDGKFGLLGLSG